jgi:hypothetical protein
MEMSSAPDTRRRPHRARWRPATSEMGNREKLSRVAPKNFLNSKNLNFQQKSARCATSKTNVGTRRRYLAEP